MSSRSADDDRVQIDQVFVMCSLVYFNIGQSGSRCMTCLARCMSCMYGVRSRLTINAPGPQSTWRKLDTSEFSYRTTLPWTTSCWPCNDFLGVDSCAPPLAMRLKLRPSSFGQRHCSVLRTVRAINGSVKVLDRTIDFWWGLSLLAMIAHCPTALHVAKSIAPSSLSRVAFARRLPN